MCSVKVGTKRFFYYNAIQRSKVTKFVFVQSISNNFNETRCYGKIKHTVTSLPRLLIKTIRTFFQAYKSYRFIKIALDVKNLCGKCFPFFCFSDTGAAKFIDAGQQVILESIFISGQEIYATNNKC